MRALFLTIGLLFSYSVAAQPQSVPASAPTSAPTDAPASAPASLTEAINLFSSGDFAGAAKRFEAAQAAGVRDPIVWYYLGRCREGLNEPAKALRAYQQYVKLAPNAPDAPAVRIRISELEASLPEGSASSPTTQANETEEPKTPQNEERLYTAQRKIGSASMGIGGMTVLMSFIFRAVSRDRAQLLEEVPPGTPFDEDLQKLDQQAKNFHTAFIVCLSTGGVLFAGGLIANLTAPKPQKADPASDPDLAFFVSPSATPTAGIRLRW